MQEFFARKQLLFAFAFLLSALPASAQLTTVSGTVVDLNGIPYAGAQLKMQLVTTAGSPVSGQPTVTINNQAQCVSGGFGSAPCQVPFPGTVGPFQISPTGTFTINLQDNTQVTPAATQWFFTVNTTGTPPPLGTGAQTCLLQITISGGSQNVKPTACPPLSVSGSVTNQPNGPVPGPPVINVKAYGAKGSFKTSINGSFGANNPQVTCTDCNFNTNAAIGDTICASVLGNTLPCSTIATITNNTTVQTTVAISSSTNTGTVGWGTFAGTAAASYDDAAVGKAQADAIAASKNSNALSQPVTTGAAITAAPILYFPSGHYLLCTQNLHDPGDSLKYQIAGDDKASSIVTWAPNCTISPTNPGLVTSPGGGTRFHDIEFDTMNMGVSGATFNTIVYTGGPAQFDNAIICCTLLGGLFSQGQVIATNLVTFGAGGNGFTCSNCNGEWRAGGSSNNGVNLSFGNVFGLNGGNGFRMIGALIDETGGNCPTQLSQSIDVWFIGTSFFGTNSNYAVCITNNSIVHFNGGLAGSFGTDTNSGGVSIDASSTAAQSSFRNVSTGTRACLANLGTLLNNGENTCESMFTVASGTSVGNTATLTVNTLGANLNTRCAVGDTAVAQGVAIAGYGGKSKFGITAVGTNTVSYTTVGSNLGALPAGGTFYCLNNRNWSGNAPTQTLAPSQFNCNIPTLTATTTTATTNCFFTPDRDILVTRVSAGLGTTPAGCATAAVLQVTNGTNSTNLTIANGAAQDDAGTVAGVLMKAGTLVGVIVQTAAAGCTTSPANAAVNFYWQAAFDN